MSGYFQAVYKETPLKLDGISGNIKLFQRMQMPILEHIEINIYTNVTHLL